MIFYLHKFQKSTLSPETNSDIRIFCKNALTVDEEEHWSIHLTSMSANDDYRSFGCMTADTTEPELQTSVLKPKTHVPH